jgi:glycosyltransferase involved in cell wall biosynthesis
MNKKLSIVIPAYNEGPTIHKILDKVKAVELIGDLEKELIIVNDCSKDNTEEAIHKYMSQNPGLNIQYYKHEVNKGKGAALVSRIPKIRIYEVGISYYGRTYEEGKKINWKDGFRAIYCIMKYNIFK